jgi:acyl dehydratase
MTIRYPDILELRTPPQRWKWDERDCILYALAMNMGCHPDDRRSLPFVYESDLRVLPTFPTVLAWIAAPTFAQLGADPVTALHGGQKIEIHEPVKVPLEVAVQGQVVDVFDKGPGRGAVIVTRHVISAAEDGRALATLTTTCFARGQGGCGGSPHRPPAPHPVPARRPDHIVDVSTRADHALLYRLTGDRNPVHCDPAVARAAGFERPILHGLCGFGLTARAILETYADLDPERMVSHEARFSAPVTPGQTLNVEMWRDGEEVSFQARLQGTARIAIATGRCLLRR